MMRWNDIFNLPDAALAGGKRIPKTMLVAQAGLTKHEQKVLDKVKRLEHFATVSKATTYILPYVDDERNIQSIIFLACEMAGSQAFAEVAHLVHKCFPNPTVIMAQVGDKACISASITRTSHANRGASVIESVETTGAFDAGDDAYSRLRDALSFGNLPQGDLWRYLQAFAWNLRLSRAVAQLGFFPMCAEGDRAKLDALIGRYDTAVGRISAIATERKRSDLTMNESSKLRMELKQVQRQQESICREIKELCGMEDAWR